MTIQSIDINKNIEIQFFDNNGSPMSIKKLYSGSGNIQIDTENWPDNRMYFYVVTTHSAVHSGKVIKIH